MAPTVRPIHAHAAEDLRFIREAMARAAEFTALPGWGGVLMGITAVVAAIVAGRRRFAAVAADLLADATSPARSRSSR